VDDGTIQALLIAAASIGFIVLAACVGLAPFSFPWLQRFSHAIAGAAITACGAAIHLGL
jgi:hypothetical protein